MTILRTYTCEGCGDQFTGTSEQAFNTGWDTPELFLSHCTCPHCSIECTAWWKFTVLQQHLTLKEIERITTYNTMYKEYTNMN